MKTIFTVNTKDIAKAYKKLYPKQKDLVDSKNFETVSDGWIKMLVPCLAKRKPVLLSLKNDTILTRRTKALLHAIEMKEPKTLGILIGQLWEIVPEE